MNLPSRYQATGKYFSGGQGVVTVWRDQSLNREVAVKVLATAGIGGSLLDEAALLAKIRSKHVVELFELGVDKKTGKEYLIMEFVPGNDLDAYVPKDLRDLYLTLYQIASGLTDIHASACIHRDLKPLNLKRAQGNIIKIIDFGIGTAKDPHITKLGMGTDGYRGPEYYSKLIKLGRAVDIYAFGSTAYKFCFGALDACLCKAPPQRPRSFATAVIGKNAQIDLEIVELLDRCFEEKPSNRPSAREIKAVLAKHLLRNRHVAHFVHGGKTYSVSRKSNRFAVNAAKGGFEVRYNDLNFILNKVTGEVFVNGKIGRDGMKLPSSCVIIVGAGSGPNRDFIPFDVSHPEVVL